MSGQPTMVRKTRKRRVMMVRQRTLQWATDDGYVFLSWPETMSPEDAADALSAINLACRSLRRISERQTSWGDFEAVMSQALNAPPTPGDATGGDAAELFAENAKKSGGDA